MAFRLERLGKVFDPLVQRPHPWMEEYAQCPVPFVLDEETIRVFITSRGQRDARGMQVSYPGYVDLDRQNLQRVKAVAAAPILDLGQVGTFDEFGITPSSIVRVGGEVYCYYTGWTRMQSIPYTMAIGLAISRDGGRTFKKLGSGPIVAPAWNEPYLASGPIVRQIDGQWHMWYLSGRGWQDDGGKPVPLYQIAHAISSDGLSWTRDGKAILPARSDDECQVSFGLFREAGLWWSIFAWRRGKDFADGGGGAYRLGLASSSDLLCWERRDAELDVSAPFGDWDGQMMCYPQVFELDGSRYLFYCGNHFGREGFGLARVICL